MYGHAPLPRPRHAGQVERHALRDEHCLRLSDVVRPVRAKCELQAQVVHLLEALAELLAWLRVRYCNHGSLPRQVTRDVDPFDPQPYNGYSLVREV